MPKSAAEFDLSITAVTGRELVSYFRKHLTAAHADLAPPLSSLSVALVGDKTMADLHVRFMSIPGPTDVLTFPLEHDRRGRVTAGEVVVCIPEAKRRIRGTKTPLKNEVLLYALHGMLHLCGFDDRTPRGFGRMHRAEDRILTRLGIGPVFGVGHPARPVEPRGSGDR
jgi:probable rRNA maturation factor